MRRLGIAGTVVLMFAAVNLADGPADNVPAAVRRVPKLGIEIKPEERRDLQEGLDDFARVIDSLAKSTNKRMVDRLPDVRVYYKAVHDALAYQEFFAANEVAKARRLLEEGQE